MALRGESQRRVTAFTVTFVSGSPTSNAFTMGAYSLGMIWLPSAFTGLGLGASIATAGGALVPLLDRSNAYGIDVSCVLPTAQLTTAYATHMPPYWFAADVVQLVSHNGTGTTIPQTSARTVTVSLKTP